MNRLVASCLLFSLILWSCKPDEEERYRSKIKDSETRQEAGDLEKAMIDINAALDIEPYGTVALYQKGMIYLLKGKYDSAIEYCNQSIATKGADTAYLDLNPNTPIGPDRSMKDVEMKLIRYCRGFSFYMLNKDDKALDDFEFCLSEGFNNKGAVFLYAGMIYANRGLIAKGCNYFRLAVLNGNDEAKDEIKKRGCKMNSDKPDHSDGVQL